MTLPFITSWYGTVDPLNPLFDAFVPVLEGSQLYTNDGLVRAKDAQWGQFWGCLPADHVDEIGQILGENPGLGNDWKYLDLYTQLCSFMRDAEGSDRRGRLKLPSRRWRCHSDRG